jgi:hypothetical protein
MQRLQRNLALLGALCATVLFTSSCQGEKSVSSGPSASASPASTMFSGQNLPAKVDRLSGTPYYRNSPEMAGIVKVDGAPFLLMAPQNPTQALLVIEQGTLPAQIVERPSQLTDFDGTTDSLESPELAKFVKDNLGLDLKKDEAGKIVTLKVAPGATSNGSAATASQAPLTPPSPGAQP